MTKKAKSPKKRNPQDLTLRNLRAIKGRVEFLEALLKDLALRVRVLERTDP